MGVWGAEDIQTLAEDASTTAFDLEGDEKAHVQVVRTDAGVTDPLVIEAFGSTDKARSPDPAFDDVPFAPRQIPADKKVVSFVVADLKHFQIKMSKVGSTDTPIVKVHTVIFTP